MKLSSVPTTLASRAITPTPMSWVESVLLAIFLLIGIFSSQVAFAQSMTSEDHILYLPGHTQVVEWSEEQSKLLFTCDYKNLQGVAPQRGEPCGEEPRLYFSKEDLRNLKYVVFDEQKNEFIYDNSRIIERIYEKFPGLLIVISTDRVYDYSGVPEPEERGQFVDVRHPVDPELYNFYAERAGKLLDIGTQNGQTKWKDSGPVLGMIVQPFESSPYLGFDPVAMDKRGEIRPLAEYGLAIFPKNPARTTIIHELLHYIIHQARRRVIRDPLRLVQLGINQGLDSYYYDRLHRKPGQRRLPEPLTPETDEELTNYIIRRGQLITETTDGAAAEEIEIRYFLSKYGESLGLKSFGIQEHINTFWRHVEDYENSLEYLGGIGRGALLEPAFSFIRKNPNLAIGNTVIENYYHYAWDDAVELALEYPKNLLTRPLDGEGSANYLQRFSQEFLPRPPRR